MGVAVCEIVVGLGLKRRQEGMFVLVVFMVALLLYHMSDWFICRSQFLRHGRV